MEVKSESEVAQLHPTLSDPMGCSLPGSSIHGIFQARVLEWVAIAENSYPLQCSCLKNPMDRGAWRGYSPWSHKESDTTDWLSLRLAMIIMLVGSAVCKHGLKSYDIGEDIICWSTGVLYVPGVVGGLTGLPSDHCSAVFTHSTVGELPYPVASWTPPLGCPPDTSKFTWSVQILDVLPHPSHAGPSSSPSQWHHLSRCTS